MLIEYFKYSRIRQQADNSEINMFLVSIQSVEKREKHITVQSGKC